MYLMIDHDILKTNPLYFVLPYLCSLKRKSTAMAKRQSFILEAKPLRLKKPKTDQSNLPSKQCNVHVFFFI